MIPGALSTVAQLGGDNGDGASALQYTLERHADAIGRSLIYHRPPGGEWTVALGLGIWPVRVLAIESDRDEAVLQALRALEREAGEE